MGFKLLVQTFRRLMKESIVFTIGVIVHLIMAIVMIIGYYTRFDFTVWNYYLFSLDFLAFYTAGVDVIQNITQLYSVQLYNVYFRYLPITAYLFVPFTLLPYDIAYLIQLTLIVVADFWMCVLIYRMTSASESLSESRKIYLIQLLGVYLMAPCHVENLALGQTNSFVGICLIYIYINFTRADQSWKSDLLGGILFTIAFGLKPLIAILSPFILIIDKEKWLTIDIKKTLIRFLPLIGFLAINGILFLRIPVLWEGFLNRNFMEPVVDSQGNSFTGFLYNNFGWRPSIVFVIIIIPLIVIPFYFYYHQSKIPLPYYILALLAAFIAYYASWYNYLVFWGPLLIPIFVLTTKRFDYLVILWMFILAVYPLSVAISELYHVNFILPFTYILFYIGFFYTIRHPDQTIKLWCKKLE